MGCIVSYIRSIYFNLNDPKKEWLLEESLEDSGYLRPEYRHVNRIKRCTCLEIIKKCYDRPQSYDNHQLFFDV